MPTEKNMRIFCDGGARGNPGPAASSFVAFLGNDLFFNSSKYLGISTNNVAEYNALLLAMEWLKANYIKTQPEEITIFLDSQLIVKQILGIFKIKNLKLKTLATKIKAIENSLPRKINYINIPREKNKLADSLVNKTLDEN